MKTRGYHTPVSGAEEEEEELEIARDLNNGDVWQHTGSGGIYDSLNIYIYTHKIDSHFIPTVGLHQMIHIH